MKLALAGFCFCRMPVDFGELPSIIGGTPPPSGSWWEAESTSHYRSGKCQSLAYPVSLAAGMVKHMTQVQPMRCAFAVKQGPGEFILLGW